MSDTDYSSAYSAIEGGPKKKSPVPLIAALAVVVVAVAGLAWAFLRPSDPKSAVESAWKASEAQWQKDADTLKKEIPLIEKLYQAGGQQASTQNYELNFESISGFEGAAMYSSLLGGSGIHGTMTTDPERMVAELTAALQVSGSDLIDGYVYTSPDLFAFGIPSFSDTMLSINPKTAVEDLRDNSYLQQLGITEQDLQELCDSLNMEFESGAAANGFAFDQEKLTADMKALFQPVMETAAFESAGKIDGLTSYTVTLEGGAVRQSVLDLVRYVYFDSDLSAIYRSAFTPMLEQLGTTYDDFVNNTMLLELEKGLPEIPVVMTVSVDGKIIRKVHLVGTPGQPALEEVTFGEIVMDFAYPAPNEQTMNLAMSVSDGGEAIDIVMDMNSAYQDNVYGVDLNMVMSGKAVTLTVNENVLYGADGTIGLDMGVDVSEDGNNVIQLSFDADGTLTTEGETDTYDFPSVQMGLQLEDGPEYSLVLSGAFDSTPLEDGYTFTGEHTPVASMTESDWAQLSSEYEAGLQGLVMKAYSLLMGA